MAAHAISSGTISFGLVSIPIKLYSSSQPQSSVSFNLLHKDCGSRLKQHYTCQKDEQKVERDQMVKGYEFEKGRYVTFSDEELKAVEEKATQAIEITEFVPSESVDPMYFDKLYYLGPDKGGDRAYKLLGEAMKQTGRYAVAKYTARGKQYLVLLRPQEGGIAMQQLHYKDEVRRMDDVPIGDADVKPAELHLAVQLVEQAASPAFNPDAYEDEVRKRLTTAIHQKIEGQEVSLPAEAPRAQIIDLMEALKASLGARPSAAPGSAAKITRIKGTDADDAAGEDGDDRKPAKKAPRRSAQSATGRQAAGGRGKG